MIVETISFCHYDSPFGFLLGLFQYVPTILYFGSWFWIIYKRDALFVGLSIMMNIFWILSLVAKFVVGPIITQPILTYNPCDSFIPSALGVIVGAIFTPSTLINLNGTNILSGTSFPHIDVLQAGIYNGYILTFIVAWQIGLKNNIVAIVGLFILSMVPWSFISSGVSTAAVVGFSYLTGIILGTFSLYIVYLWVLTHKKTGSWLCTNMEESVFYKHV